MNNTLKPAKAVGATIRSLVTSHGSPLRRRILTGAVEVATQAALEECCTLHGFTLLALETDEDHVHCLVSAPPKDSPAKIVGLLKGHRSRRMRAQFPQLAKKTGREQLWTSAYYVGTAGQVGAEVIRRYITESQGK
jgi:putative transposase